MKENSEFSDALFFSGQLLWPVTDSSQGNVHSAFDSSYQQVPPALRGVFEMFLGSVRLALLKISQDAHQTCLYIFTECALE